jgi:hypothetical protein
MADNTRQLLFPAGPSLNQLYPEHGPNWIPPNRFYTSEDRQTFLDTIHEWEATFADIQEHVVHHLPREVDTYDGLMDWRRFYGEDARILIIMNTEYEIDESSANPTGCVRFRHILYSVIDSQNPDDTLMWITLRRVRDDTSLIAASERPYFLFRALMSGIWKESHGMHIFLFVVGAKTGVGYVIAWFQRNMNHYANQLVFKLMRRMASWNRDM